MNPFPQCPDIFYTAGACHFNCAPETVVAADSIALPMSGGNLPVNEAQLLNVLYAKKSGWSVMGIALLFGVVLAAGGFFLAPQLGAGVTALTGGGGRRQAAAAPVLAVI